MLVGTKPFLHNIANIDSDFIVLLQQLFIVGQKCTGLVLSKRLTYQLAFTYQYPKKTYQILLIYQYLHLLY